MIIEDPDGPRGQERQVQAYTIYAINLALFDKPYVEPQEITLEAREEVPKPAQVLEKCRKRQGRCMSCPWLFLWAGNVMYRTLLWHQVGHLLSRFHLGCIQDVSYQDAKGR